MSAKLCSTAGLDNARSAVLSAVAVVVLPQSTAKAAERRPLLQARRVGNFVLPSVQAEQIAVHAARGAAVRTVAVTLASARVSGATTAMPAQGARSHAAAAVRASVRQRPADDRAARVRRAVLVAAAALAVARGGAVLGVAGAVGGAETGQSCKLRAVARAAGVAAGMSSPTFTQPVAAAQRMRAIRGWCASVCPHWPCRGGSARNGAASCKREFRWCVQIWALERDRRQQPRSKHSHPPTKRGGLYLEATARRVAQRRRL
eukprot:4035224-Pleurochrysis_carterae.AAC.3